MEVFTIYEGFTEMDISELFTKDSTGYMGDPTNSIKIPKEQIVHREIKHSISKTWPQNTASPIVYNIMGWLRDGSNRGQGCQAWTAVGQILCLQAPRKVTEGCGLCLKLKVLRFVFTVSPVFVWLPPACVSEHSKSITYSNLTTESWDLVAEDVKNEICLRSDLTRTARISRTTILVVLRISTTDRETVSNCIITCQWRDWMPFRIHSPRWYLDVFIFTFARFQITWNAVS